MERSGWTEKTGIYIHIYIYTHISGWKIDVIWLSAAARIDAWSVFLDRGGPPMACVPAAWLHVCLCTRWSLAARICVQRRRWNIQPPPPPPPFKRVAFLCNPPPFDNRINFTHPCAQMDPGAQRGQRRIPPWLFYPIYFLRFFVSLIGCTRN